MRYRGEEPEDDSLVEWLERPTPATSRVLITAITGFLDAGNAVRAATDHLREVLEHRVLALFDIDLLFNYRERRPMMQFRSDHFEGVGLPSLSLIEFIDERGTPFLVLVGDEPDLGWQTVTDAIIELVEDLDVNLTVGLAAVPFPAPHTRPVPITAHSNDPLLITGRQPWVGDIDVPGALSSLIELQLAEEGHRSMGFAAHVPHYLAGMDHPRSALALLTEVMGATGLVLPLDELRERADEADVELNGQIAGNSENEEVVRGLEQSYDQMAAGRAEKVDSPSGDELAEQIERFLAEMDARGNDQE